jgi:hypothetical protein
MIDIKDVTIVTPPGGVPPYSTHGYCVTQDGTIYALLRKWWHGAVLALLYPEDAAKAEYVLPDSADDVDVFEFQKFELDNHDQFPVIRICPGRLMGPTSIDRGRGPCTNEQIVAVRAIVKTLGLTAHDEVCTEHKDMKVHEMYDFLANNLDVWGGTPREAANGGLVKKSDPDYWDSSDAGEEDSK